MGGVVGHLETRAEEILLETRMPRVKVVFLGTTVESWKYRWMWGLWKGLKVPERQAEF
jgi:hypothetical protein